MFKNPTTYSGFPPLAKEQLIELLGGWEGYQLGTVGRQPSRDGSEELWLELLPRDRRRKICSGCGQVVESVHDRMERWVRDLPILGATVWLLVWRCRLACPRCGPKLESLSWLAPYSRLTRRLELEVARLCRWLPVAHVAEYIGLHRHTVKAIDFDAVSPAQGFNRDTGDVDRLHSCCPDQGSGMNDIPIFQHDFFPIKVNHSSSCHHLDTQLLKVGNGFPG